MDMKKICRTVLALGLALSMTACGKVSVYTDKPKGEERNAGIDAESTSLMHEETETSETSSSETAADNAGTDNNSNDADNAPGKVADAAASGDTAADPAVEKNGEIYILFTSDIHCGINEGFGFSGLWQIRKNLERQGYETILVDDGDAIQGEAIGTLSEGQSVMDLMNDMGYDLATIGNHEFDYGMDRFKDLVQQARFKYICCNFTYLDEPVFDPYVIKEVAGHKIGFVGVATPTTLVTSTPTYFKDDSGEYVYGFMQDETGEKLYDAVQKSVDAVRAEGAELVYCVAHLGNKEGTAPWTYVDVISHTSGIDVMLDGHSHDTDQVVMKNKDGKDVCRSGVGTKMNSIGYSHILADGTIDETGIWSWPNGDPAPGLLALDNEMQDRVDKQYKNFEKEMNSVIARSDVDLTIFDPEEVDSNGNPIRIVRRQETNMGDFCTDAYREMLGTDISIINAGGIRDVIKKGNVTFEDILNVQPYNNSLCVIQVTGQQILDALEWGVSKWPEESGGFPQVSGLTFEVRTDIESPCITNDNLEFAGIKGERRVQNVVIGDKSLRPDAEYSIGGIVYILRNNGDGYTMFDKATVISDNVSVDNQVLSGYINEKLEGVIGEEYADPYGQGRIKILADE
ncbi:MAG: bifunctional metallophosphatase/5'-nucleotidase [Lachnospiraceae bacterium]|nr:bifunctional metallophosphatase/5'-nucleotidase [Lachnospiraceae bacterium]